MTDQNASSTPDYRLPQCDWNWQCERKAVALRHYQDQQIPVCSVHAGDVSRPSADYRVRCTYRFGPCVDSTEAGRRCRALATATNSQGAPVCTLHSWHPQMPASARPDGVLDRLRAVSGSERAPGQTVWVLNADVVAALDYIAQLEAQ